MKKVAKVRSTLEPERLAIDEYSVWIAENIIDISENKNEGNGFVGFEYTQTHYLKDEYILEIDKKRKEDKTGTELALADLAEMLLGGA